jgi:predicted nuclease with RNAse H fold
MIVIGADLSGPANAKDTCLVVFRAGPRVARLLSAQDGAADKAIVEAVGGIEPSEPLSYSPGGGVRLADSALRKQVVAAGLSSGSVMVPTMPRMAYLTLRGVVVARSITLTRTDAAIVEVHPCAAMVLRGAPISTVHTMKKKTGVVSRCCIGSKARPWCGRVRA